VGEEFNRNCSEKTKNEGLLEFFSIALGYSSPSFLLSNRMVSYKRRGINLVLWKETQNFIEK
jgi:hypothetical protein